MTNDDLIVFTDLVKLYPQKYDAAGWFTLVQKLSKIGVDIDDINIEELPESKKEITAKASKIRQAAVVSNTRVVAIDADKFVALPADKQDAEFENFIHGFVEGVMFPPIIIETDPLLQEYIKTNYAYTLANDGKPIVYHRVPELDGNVWDECGDGEKPFLLSRGPLRSSLINHIVMRSKAVSVTVLYKDANGSTSIMEHVPYYRIHKKYIDEAMKAVTGKEANRAVVKERYVDWVKDLERCFNGNLHRGELQHGMQEIPKMLEELDANLLNMTFFYYDKINLPDLTNDPAEAARAYFDLNLIKPGPTPDFDGFMLSIDEACRDSLMAAIYATFFAKSHLNQYIWIHGEGGDGKSSLLNAIAEYAGDHLACSLGQTMNSEFGLENAVGKRMVILSDVKTGLSVKSQLIHNLTGHDPLSINRKNKPIITARLDPIVWIAANSAPDVNFDNRNEARRCLYIKMCEPPVEVKRKFYFTDENGNFVLDANGKPINNGYDLQGGLVREMPHILYKCKEAFERVCPAPYSVIRQTFGQSSLALENCIDLDANEWATYLEETFDFTNKDAKLKITEIHERLQATREHHGEKNALNNFARRDIIRLLCIKYNCSKKKIDGVRYLEGIDSKKDKALRELRERMNRKPGEKVAGMV
jgi:hypothetical protein